MKTINITLKIDESEVPAFEQWLRMRLEVIDFKILPDTEKLYEDSKTFQKLVKEVKKAQRLRDSYINEFN